MKVKYLIQLKGRNSDLFRLSKNFSNKEFQVIKENDSFYLTSSEFNCQHEVDDVYHLSCQIIKKVNSVSNVLYGKNPEIFPETVYQVQEDGTRVGFTYLSGTIEAGQCDVYITQIKGCQVINSQAESFTNWFDIQNDKNVDRILELFNNKTWVNLYQIYEIIESEVGNKIYKDQDGWTSKNKITQFTRTANSPDCIGNQSRHGVQKTDPPPNPMSLQDAQLLIRSIIEKWLNWKCHTQ